MTLEYIVIVLYLQQTKLKAFTHKQCYLIFLEPKPEPSVKAQMPQATPKSTVSAFISQYSPITPVTPLTPSSSSPMNQAQGSVLKDLLQNKQKNFDAKPAETKNDANTFMGQKICSPSTFACK